MVDIYYWTDNYSILGEGGVAGDLISFICMPMKYWLFLNNYDDDLIDRMYFVESTVTIITSEK